MPSQHAARIRSGKSLVIGQRGPEQTNGWPQPVEMLSNTLVISEKRFKQRKLRRLTHCTCVDPICLSFASVLVPTLKFTREAAGSLDPNAAVSSDQDGRFGHQITAFWRPPDPTRISKPELPKFGITTFSTAKSHSRGLWVWTLAFGKLGSF